MKLLIFALILLSSCQEQKSDGPSQKTMKEVSRAGQVGQEEFSDLKKKDDESCDTKEDLEKKIMEEAKKKPQEAFKLQGADTGCSTH